MFSNRGMFTDEAVVKFFANSKQSSLLATLPPPSKHEQWSAAENVRAGRAVLETYYALMYAPLDFHADERGARVAYFDRKEEEVNLVRWRVRGDWTSDYFCARADVQPVSATHMPTYSVAYPSDAVESCSEITMTCSYLPTAEDQSGVIAAVGSCQLGYALRESEFYERYLGYSVFAMDLVDVDDTIPRFHAEQRRKKYDEFDDSFFEPLFAFRLLPTATHLFKCWLDLTFGPMVGEFVRYAHLPGCAFAFDRLHNI